MAGLRELKLRFPNSKILRARVTADNCRDQKGEISDSSRNREISPRAQISPGRDLPFEGGIWMAPKYRARQIPPFWSLQLSAVIGVCGSDFSNQWA